MTAEEFTSSRSARPSDLDCILELAELMLVELRPERGGEALLVHDLIDIAVRRRYEDALADGVACVAVGLIDGACVGYAVAVVSKPSGPANCMIEELYVHPRARGVGVGAQLLAHARSWGLAAGCVAIESHVLPGNRNAKNFFERVGMVTRKMQVSVEI